MDDCSNAFQRLVDNCCVANIADDQFYGCWRPPGRRSGMYIRSQRVKYTHPMTT